MSSLLIEYNTQNQGPPFLDSMVKLNWMISNLTSEQSLKWGDF